MSLDRRREAGGSVVTRECGVGVCLGRTVPESVCDCSRANKGCSRHVQRLCTVTQYSDARRKTYLGLALHRGGAGQESSTWIFAMEATPFTQMGVFAS
jgi:hypothetical protein